MAMMGTVRLPPARREVFANSPWQDLSGDEMPYGSKAASPPSLRNNARKQ